MLTGISGSNTVRMASRIAGFSASVLPGSGTSVSVSEEEGSGSGEASGIMGSGLILLLGGDDRFPVERSLERVPRQAGALDAHRELPHPGEDRELSHVLDSSFRRSGDHRMESLEQG